MNVAFHVNLGDRSSGRYRLSPTRMRASPSLTVFLLRPVSDPYHIARTFVTLSLTSYHTCLPIDICNYLSITRTV